MSLAVNWRRWRCPRWKWATILGLLRSCRRDLGRRTRRARVRTRRTQIRARALGMRTRRVRMRRTRTRTRMRARMVRKTW